MKLHGQFGRDTDDKKSEKLWYWVRNGSWKRETESLLSAARKLALNTNSVGKIYHENDSYKCRLCGTHVENVLHIVKGCNMLAQKDYKRRQDKVCLKIHWALCKRYGVKACERWYEHKGESVIENDIVKILCSSGWINRTSETDIVVMEKTTIIRCPIDNNLILKRNEKLDNYFELLYELRVWNKEFLTLSRPPVFRKCSSEDFLICFSRSKIIQTSFGPISIVLAVQEIIFGSPVTQSS